MDLYDVVYYAFFGVPFLYLIFFLWLVWTKTLWSKKIKIFVTVFIVIIAIILCYSFFFFDEPVSHGGCQDIVPLGE